MVGYLDVRADRVPTVEDFRTAFQKIAAFLGRPSSPIALFSGVPLDDSAVTVEDIQSLGARIGLDVTEQRLADLMSGRFVLPALLLLADGKAVPLLDRAENGGFVTSLESPHLATTADLMRANARSLVSFSMVYLNASELNGVVGSAPQIERRHWLVDTLAPFWRTYLQVALAALFINLLALASPLFTMNVYDRVLPNKAIATLWVLAIGVGLATTFDLLLKTVRAALIDYAGRQADLKLSYLLFEKVLDTSLGARPTSTGEYASRVTQYEFVREFFTSNTISVLIDTVFVFVFLIAIYLLAGWLVIIPACAFAIALLIGLITQFRIGRRVAAASNEAAQRQAILVETISTLETIKALRAEAILLRRWRELSKNAARTSEQIKQLSSSAGNWTQFVQQLVAVGIVIAGSYEFAEGNLSTGAIIACVMLASRAVAPLGQIALTLSRLRQAILSLRILDTIMAQPEDRPNSVGFVNREISSGSFSFRNVDFAYPGSDYKVLNGLSFSVGQGERVGIIGRIGSGKTTIGRLLGGLYPAGGGTVTIDGVDARQYHPAVVREAVAVAGQSTDLFSGTVKENLLMGRSGASDEEIVEAAKATGVDEFVARHPRGYDMPVGERGNNLSGGQKQAVTIARLLLARPRIVFLDEPSGAMDLASERALISKLSAAFDQNRTVVISTHRYSMLELVDRLIVIDQGKVVADGPKKSVIEELQRRAMAPR